MINNIEDNKLEKSEDDYNLELLSYKISEFEAYLTTRNERLKDHTIRKMYMKIYYLMDSIKDKQRLKKYKLKFKKILLDYGLYFN